MTVAYDMSSYRGWSSGSQSAVCLEDKFEILKDIGDGSFGSVTLGRTRGAGAHIVRRGTLVILIVCSSCCFTLTYVIGGDQDDEEDFRELRSMHGTA